MDPRKARDPRLARADPRLQNRPPSNSPAPTPPPTQYGTQHQDVASAYNSVSQAQMYGTLLVAQNGVETAPVMNIAGPSSYQPQSSEFTPVPTQPPVSKYKQRPLFCVVCASNNVSLSLFYLIYKPTSFRTALWKDITSSRKSKSNSLIRLS